MVKILTSAELFRLDTMEGIARRTEDGTSSLFYLFRLDGLLPGGQMLAMNVRSGATQTCTAGAQSTIVAEARLNEVETRLVTALVLSHPCSVAGYQMLTLYTLREMTEVKEEIARAQKNGDDRLMQPLRDLVTACNRKLKPLGIAINWKAQKYDQGEENAELGSAKRIMLEEEK